MKNFILFSKAMLAFAFLGGCATVPVYQTKITDVKVQIEGVKIDRVQVCKEGKWFRLERFQQGNKTFVNVPLGEDIGLSYSMTLNGSNGGTTYCHTAVTFSPEAEQEYFANGEFWGNQCILEVLRKAPKEKFGLIKDESVKPFVGNNAQIFVGSC